MAKRLSWPGGLMSLRGCPQARLQARNSWKAAALGAVEARLFDLLPVVRNNYYHPAFRGSFSIKSVLPALVPESGYDDLSIADGQTAAARYVKALGSADRVERRRTFEELRAYCARDTLAMVELRGALAKLERSASSPS